jgi:hypothetical protein
MVSLSCLDNKESYKMYTTDIDLHYLFLRLRMHREVNYSDYEIHYGRSSERREERL